MYTLLFRHSTSFCLFHFQDSDLDFEVPDLLSLGLFTLFNMEPMVFSLAECPQRENVQKLIEQGGGLLENPKLPDKTGHRIDLIDRRNRRVCSFRSLFLPEIDLSGLTSSQLINIHPPICRILQYVQRCQVRVSNSFFYPCFDSNEKCLFGGVRIRTHDLSDYSFRSLFKLNSLTSSKN